MTAYEHLFYGLGYISYAIALSDGAVQKEEEQKLKEIIAEKLKEHEIGYDITGIIFRLIEDESIFDVDSAYEVGLKNIDLGHQYLTEDIKRKFLDTAKAVALAFPPYHAEESKIIIKFMKDLKSLN